MMEMTMLCFCSGERCTPSISCSKMMYYLYHNLQIIVALATLMTASQITSGIQQD